MNIFKTSLAAAALLMSINPTSMLAADIDNGSAPRMAQRPAVQPHAPSFLWFYDGRSDDGDFPTNGFFPGDFAASPASAAIGTAGLLGEGRPYGTRDVAPAELLASKHHHGACSHHPPHNWKKARRSC